MTDKIYNANNHRIETYLTVLNGYLQGALTVCDNIENNIKLFPTWDGNVSIYIAAAADLVSKLNNTNSCND